MSTLQTTTRDSEPVQRANEPGVYVCPHCGEKLSGPARDYLCPGRIPVENLGRQS